MDLASHILRMVPRHWQDQYKLTGLLYPKVFVSYSKHLSASKRPSHLRRKPKGLRQMQMEVVPPRKEWSHSAIESQRSPAGM